MARYRVTVRTSTTDIVDAQNEYMAAVVVAEGRGDDVEVVDVRPAVGRASGGNGMRTPAKKAAKKATKTVAKKRRRMSPEARAKLAQNLVKARAARAAKRKGAGKKTATKKTATKKRAAKKRAKRA